jgi:hypothetical protein
MNLETNKSLDARFAALRLATADALPPAETDRAIADAIARARAARPQATRARFRWPAWPVWAAFATAAAIALVMLRPLPTAVVDDPLRAADSAADDAFVPVVPLADIERSGDALVVPARVPRTTLAELGFPVNPAHGADAVDAELLVRGDGSLLAVRLIP